MTRKLTLTAFLLITLFLFALMFSQPSAVAQTEPSRQAAWYEVNYASDAFGGTFLIGQYGPDIGIGEQGSVYQYSNPLTGQYVSYQSTGIGSGVGGALLGYGGMFSPVAQQSYGPFAYGQSPTVSASPGYDTQGYLFGNLWGQNVNYFASQYNPFAGLLLGGFGSFGSPAAFSGGLFGLGRVGLSTANSFGPLYDDDYRGAFRSSAGNIYGGVNLFYFDEFEDEFDD
ncbi:MAG: hypothetical protein ACMUIM_03445 [bacterium]